MITIYHNPRCSKSREAFKLLQEKGVNFNVRLYLEEGMDKDVLSLALKTLGEQMIRQKEDEYKRFIAGKNLSHDELVEALLRHPKTIERPLVTNGKKMALGRPLTNVEEIL